MKPLRFVFSLILFLFIPILLNAEESTTLLNNASQKLTLLESKVRQLGATQSQMIQKLDQIDQELDSLRIWIRRHRGGN